MANWRDPVEEFRRLIKSGSTPAFKPSVLKQPEQKNQKAVDEYRKLVSSAWEGYEKRTLYDNAGRNRAYDTQNRLKSFQDDYTGTLKAGASGVYHSPDAYADMLKAAQTGYESAVRDNKYFEQIGFTDQQAYDYNQYAMDYFKRMQDAALEQQQHYGQFNDWKDYYQRTPMYEPVREERKPDGPTVPYDPRGELPEDTRMKASTGATDVTYRPYQPPVLSPEEQLKEMGRGEKYMQYEQNPDNLRSQREVGYSFMQRMARDPIMDKLIENKEWGKYPEIVNFFKHNREWDKMAPMQRMDAMIFAFQSEADKYEARLRTGQDQTSALNTEERIDELRYRLTNDPSLVGEEYDKVQAEFEALQLQVDSNKAIRESLFKDNEELNARRELALKQKQDAETIKGFKLIDQKYAAVELESDYTAKSRFDQARMPSANKQKDIDTIYEYINSQGDRRKELELPHVTNSVTTFGAPMQIVTDRAYILNGVNTLTENEVKIFNYLYNTAGPKAAEEYLTDKGTELKARRALLRQQRMQELTEQDMEFMSLASLYMNLENAFLGPLQMLSGMAGGDKNDAIFDKVQDVSAIRGTAGQYFLKDIFGDAQVPGLGVSWSELAYGALMSAGDSAIGRALGGLFAIPSLNTTLMTSRIAGTAMKENMDRGLDTGKAFLNTMVSAVIENVTERLGDTAFFSSPDKVMTYIARNILSEGAEELLAEVGNVVADFAINGPKSEIYQKSLDLMLSKGWSFESANAYAQKEFMKEVGAAGLSGALMGGLSSAGGIQGYMSRSAENRKDRRYDEIMTQEGMGLTEQDRQNLAYQQAVNEAFGIPPVEIDDTITPQQAPDSLPADSDIAPRRAPERPVDPASEAIAMPPVQEDIAPRKEPERPTDPAAERIEAEPQTGTGYTGLAREYGMAGLRTSDLESVIGKENLTDEVLQAHKEGVAQAKVEARTRAEEILGRRETAAKRGYLKSISEQEATANGVNTIGKMSPAIRKASTALRVIAESTGINVVLFESPINDKGEHTGKQGWFDSGKRTIYLDVKAGYGNEEATMRAAGHELTHVIQKFSPEFYENTYKPAVIDALYEGNEGTMIDLVQEQIRIAKENGKTMTESQAMFEVVADASERMLMGDQETITGLVEQNPDLFKRVKNWIDNFVNSLRRAYTILKADSSAAKVLEGTYERFKGIQEMWWNGLQDAALNIRGQQEAMPISAYEQSRDAAREAKLQRIGTGLINPAMYEPVDYRQYAPKPQAQPEVTKLAEEGKKTTPTTAKKPPATAAVPAEVTAEAPAEKPVEVPVKTRENAITRLLNEMEPPFNQPVRMADGRLMFINRTLSGLLKTDMPGLQTTGEHEKASTFYRTYFEAPFADDAMFKDVQLPTPAEVKRMIAAVNQATKGMKQDAKDKLMVWVAPDQDIAMNLKTLSAAQTILPNARALKSSNAKEGFFLRMISDDGVLVMAQINKANYNFQRAEMENMLAQYEEPTKSELSTKDQQRQVGIRKILSIDKGKFSKGWINEQGKQTFISGYHGVVYNEPLPGVPMYPAGEMPVKDIKRIIPDPDTEGVVRVTLPTREDLKTAIAVHNEAFKEANKERESRGVKPITKREFGGPLIHLSDINMFLNADYMVAIEQALPDATEGYFIDNRDDQKAVSTAMLVFESELGQGLILPVNVNKENGQGTRAHKVEARPVVDTKPKATTKKQNALDQIRGMPKAFIDLVERYAADEAVGLDLQDAGNKDSLDYVNWAKKWYNHGREGTAFENVPPDNNDLNYPPFLQNVFYDRGKADTKKSIKPTKPVEAGGKHDVRGTEDYDTGRIQEVEERLPGQGQADEPATVETVGAGPQAGGILEEVSSEDVQQPGGPGGTARDSDGGIRPAVRDDVTTDAPGTTRGPGVGSGERGDLRNPSRDTNDDVVQAAAEAAKRREAEANKGKNYVIPPEGLDLPGGQKTRFNLNVEAIKIAKALEAEGRIAAPEEQQALARYVGWGGIPDAFDARGRVKEGWEAENQTLKELLSEEEYDAARRSTTNAHYTEIGIIRSMYGALKKWGFKGGYVLEPSSGIGNFIGAAPSFGKQARWTAVELDSTTALIAKHLYPQASVHHAGFQDVQLPDNYFDLAISNVPFSETGPVDKKYPKFLRSNLHNYFFVKSMDKVRPGGLVMFITSRFTMDSANSSFREYMARHADLVGAVRLPDTAFKQNANTEVVTDLLVFKKRQPNTEYTGQPFAHAGVQIFDSPHTSYGARHNVNEYFLNNPDMVLGTPTISRGMYSANTLTYKAIEGKALTEQLSEALSKINVKVDYVERTADPMKAADEVVKASSRTKNNGYEVKDGKVYQNNNGTLDLADDINQSPDKLARVTTMLGLRDLRKQLLHAQLQGKEKAETDRLRKELNKQYDAFVKKHGFLNSKENARLMYDDPDSFSLLALEDYRPAEDGKPEQAIKTDIFVKDTIASATRATSAKNPEEALAISINELGYLEPERMGELLSVTPDQAEALLLEQQLAFKDEDGALIPAPVYLSGRVRSKLIIAKQMASVDKSYQANVEALESVIPADVPVEDISMPLGATWIPTEYYEGFIRHILDLPTYQGQVKVQMNPLTSSYKIELNSAAKRSIGRRADIKYGAGNWSFLKILDKIMNGGSMKATYKDQDGRTQTDKATTAAINEKAEQIKSEFVQWIKSDPDLAAPIARLYNDTFNDTVEATFDGENLTIDGANPSMPLKPHQKAVIQRALQSGGNMLIAHATGAGKTAEMAGIAMKMRQLGILKKPLFVVPKPVATQWGQEFLTFFPNAKVLVPQDADYEARNRKTYINKIISNDYDAVILSYEMFEAVPLSGEAMRSFYQAQIDEAMEALQAAKDDDTEGDRVYYSRAKPLGKDWTVKQIEKQLEKLQKRIEELDSKNKRDEDNVDFEELGVDGLFVDEAHNFKNLRVYTHLQNVAGINTSAEAGRAFDLLAKVQHMQKLNGGKGVFFATATPVMNTLGELFVMQRYLMPDVMRDKGIYNFDAWVNAFASVMKELSINATGTGYKVKDTLSKFVNLPELQTMFRSFADVIPVVEGLKIPEVKGGKPFIHEVEPTEFQKEYVKELADRANNIKGRPEKGADNMLKITTDGQKVAMSGRMVDVTQDIELDGKLAVTAKEIVRVYKESKKHKGTQLVFLDIGVPGANEALNMYAALKDMLVAAGIPSAEIKTIYDAKDEVDRKKLFRQVNDGTIRVLMGSTKKMGTGVNVQQRVAAMHHIDVPYRPGDLTQRNGRGQRQGNLYTDLDGIEIHYYVTKGTFDSYMWQKVQTKSAFIEQLMTNENKLRESEGESMTLTAAEVTAIASGNPMILEKFALENDLMKLAALKDQHDNDITHAKKQIHSNKTQIASLKKQIEAVKKDIAQKVDTKGDKFSMVVGNTTYKDRVKAGEALIAMYSKASKGTFPAEGLKAGKLGGFNIVLQSQGAMLLQTNRGVVALINPESASGTISRLENSLNFDGQVEGLEMLVSKAEADIAAYQEALEKPFERQEEYTQKKTRYVEIMSILAPSQNEGAETSDEEAADGFDGMESDEENLDYSFRRLASDDFLQEREDDPGRIEDRTILAERLDDLQYSDRDSTGRALSQEQQEYFKDSKVRDEQGRLLVVYHGVKSPNMEIVPGEVLFSAPFSEFDVSKESPGKIEPGAWFSPDKSVARLYGTPVPYYLNAKTPIQDESPISKKPKEHDAVYRMRSSREGIHNAWEIAVFSPEQIKEVTNLTPTSSPDIRYSDRDPSRLSNRERLVDALETVALNDYEKDIIKRYKDRLESITQDAELLKATNAQIRELSFAPGPRDMDQLNKLKNNKQTLLNKIARQDARLLKIEAAQPLANLVNLEKRRAERALKQQRADLRREYKQEVQERVREVRQKGAEKLAKYKQNQESREYKAQITALVKNMSEKLVNPSKNGYYPEALKGPLGDVLKSINEQSKRSLAGGDSTKADREFYDRLNKLQSVLSRINRSQQSAEAMSEDYAELAGFVDLPAGFVERMAELADIMERYMKMNTGEYVLNAMTAEELKALFKMLTALDRSLETINKLHIQGVFAHVDQMGKYSIQHGDNMKSKLHREGKIDKFLNWDNTLPVYAFERMGKAGQSLFDGFRRGMDKQSKLAQEIVDFSENTFTPAEAREWGKQIITVTLDGNEVRLTAAHLMELYAHNRREQSRGHIYGAGIKVNNFKVGNTTYAHRGDVTLPSEITAAFEQLTDRQKEVALALQTFMSKRGGGLIDEVNMARFGAKQLDDENDTYWPIKSVPQNIDTKMEAPEGNPLYRILNMSFMKPLTKGANNQIVISNIFDTFASHMADVIQLNAFALPVLDAIKWFNYRQSYKNPETGQKYVSSVRSSIRNAFGEAGEKYVTRMLLDLNGSRMTGGGEEAAMTMLRHYNRSVVAANLRVALLQPTSITRALNVIDARYLSMGALTNLAHLRRNIREMEKHSGIAIWKQLGFYDVNISRSIQDLIKRDNPLMDRLTDKTMVLPQTMDRITWAAIWDASKRQAAAENPGLNKNSEEYWDKVKALFDTAIYKTQVVDTMLTRSEYMRRPSFVAKWTSSFMSEPTMTYNILSSQVHTFNDDVASGMSRGAAWRKNGRKITRTATAYALSVALVTMAEALSGAWRDDDEYMTFMEKLAKAYKNNLIDNLMPLNLPIINDLWQITKRFVGQTFGVDLWGFADASPLTQGVQLMYDGFTAVTKVMNGEGKNMTLYGAGYKLLQGISAVTGHPFSSMTREVVDLWNNTAGKMYPEYKVKRYEQSMTSGYKALFDALQGGDNERSQKIRDVLDRMGVDDKKVYSGLREQAREAYKEGKLDFDDAVSMLGAEQGSPDNGLYWTVKEWEARREADDWSTEFEYSRYNALYDAVLSGENLREIVKELQENFSGQPENAKSTIARQISNHFEPKYIEAYKRSKTEAANLKARLLTVYALLGYDRTKKNKDIDAWLKQK